MFSEDDLLSISGLQHLMFCERQWALIHMEGEWNENVLTVEGKQLHEFVHSHASENRSGVRMARGLQIRSLELGLYGVADMVEFHPCGDGARITGHRGLWRPYPVEYKRGRKRRDHANEMQLCAQAVCLEEMFGVKVPVGAIYYGQPKRRGEVEISDSLRTELASACSRMRALYDQEDNPRPTVGSHCKSCSLCDECMPNIISGDRSKSYVDGIMRDLSDQNPVGRLMR
jgi:CRISPR-associated exonuclease Cas4